MPIFLFNFTWIIPNIFLALIPVVLTYIWKKRLPAVLNVLVLFLWFLFLPNSIYLVTDIEYLPHQISITPFPELFLVDLQYLLLIVLGIFTYLYSIQPAISFAKRRKLKNGSKKLFFITLNFIVAFAVILGKVERTHSYYVFTQPYRVIRDIHTEVLSLNLLLAVLGMGILINMIYFASRNYLPYSEKNNKRKKK